VTKTPAAPKRRAPAKGKRAPEAVPAPAPPASGSPPRPFLTFHPTGRVHEKTLAVLDALEQAADPTVHRDALAGVVEELTNWGMNYCFLQPLEHAKVGFLVQQSANIALAGTLQVMSSVIRKIIGRMDGPQLLSVSGYIRRLMV